MSRGNQYIAVGSEAGKAKGREVERVRYQDPPKTGWFRSNLLCPSFGAVVILTGEQTLIMNLCFGIFGNKEMAHSGKRCITRKANSARCLSINERPYYI